MIQRSECLCNGVIIGIETIYTVIDGKQINIPDKLKVLRSKGQNNELFCPCGCGRNFIVVAGEKGLREQHFRIKKGQSDKPPCSYVDEGEISVSSKIVLKCWLDDKIHASDLESRVPICAVDDSKRKYEFTFISRQKHIAVNYCFDKRNLSEEKMSILDQNSRKIHLFHVIDEENRGYLDQYPETAMKVQNRQGYCLFLSVATSEYEKARLKAAFYEKNIDGLWRETVFADGLLREYSIDLDFEIQFHRATLSSLLEKARETFAQDQAKEKERREEDRRRSEEERKRREEEEKEEEEKRIAALKKLEEENEKYLNSLLAEEKENKKTDLEWDHAIIVHNQIQQGKQRAKLEEEKKAKKIRDSLWPEFKETLEKQLSQQKEPVVDPDGERWYKCEFCGKISKTGGFQFHGGTDHMNLGTCHECHKKGLRREEKPFEPIKVENPDTDPDMCPVCGGKLKLRNGKYGAFMGCSNYPKCSYTRNVK